MDLKIETNYIPTEEPTNWSDIEGLNKPENNATRNQIFAQNDAPTADYKEGDYGLTPMIITPLTELMILCNGYQLKTVP